MDPNSVIGLLAEPERLRVVAALALGARTPSQLKERTGLDQRSIGRALQRLDNGGLVSSGHDGFVLHEDAFKEAARRAAPKQVTEEHGYADSRTESTLRTFVRDGTVLRLPAQRSRRRVVLEHVARSLEPGTRYSEREIDVVLRAWCDGGGTDHVTLRRHLVDEGVLSREAGAYWRSGGWVDVLGP